MQPVKLHVIGVGAMADPLACTVAGWGTDQSTLLCPPLDTDFNFGASLRGAGTVTVHFTEITSKSLNNAFRLAM